LQHFLLFSLLLLLTKVKSELDIVTFDIPMLNTIEDLEHFICLVIFGGIGFELRASECLLDRHSTS
jgi:hypothetical protein